MTKNQFLNWGKVQNCQKYNFTKKKSELFDFTRFFPWPLKFSGPLCNHSYIEEVPEINVTDATDQHLGPRTMINFRKPNVPLIVDIDYSHVH